MPQTLTLAVAQSRTLPTLGQSLASLSKTTQKAASQNVDLLLFPEAYLGGYPRSCNFGSAVGSRSDIGREQFLHYFNAAVDLGDTPRGGGDEWVERRLPPAKGKEVRGDGTREHVERVAAETGVFLVVGVVEKAGGSLYCACIYVCPRLGCIGKRRKVMPTGTERLVWAQGSPSTLRAVTTTIRGVKLTMAAAICWENYMPLLRYALYAQNVNLFLAPTADARDTWLPLMRTIALEGRAFVLSANQCTRESDLPGWITGKPDGEAADATAGSSGEVGGKGKGLTNGAPPPPPPSSTRRKSIIAVTEDNHELCLPAASATTTTNPTDSTDGVPLSPQTSITSSSRRKSTTVTEDNHELRLPASSSPVPVPAPGPTTKPPTTTTSSSSSSNTSTTVLCRGGSSIVHPTGAVLQGPLWDDPGSDGSEEDGADGTPTGTLLVARADFEDCIRGRLDFDAGGSYSRNDAFRLSVEGLVLDPPA